MFRIQANACVMNALGRSKPSATYTGLPLTSNKMFTVSVSLDPASITVCHCKLQCYNPLLSIWPSPTCIWVVHTGVGSRVSLYRVLWNPKNELPQFSPIYMYI